MSQNLGKVETGEPVGGSLERTHPAENGSETTGISDGHWLKDCGAIGDNE